MLAMIESGDAKEAHPALWAPFVVVGEGSPVESAGAQIPMAPAPAKKAAAKSSLKKQAPWTADIWRKQAN
jgi:hypothetical protein